MSQASSVDQKRSLFPSGWVIGTAAADLARNDPGVLLPGDPIPEDQREGAGESSLPAATAGNVHSRAAEIAALHAENERLRQRIMATRQRLRPLVDRANGEPRGVRSDRMAADPARNARHSQSTAPRRAGIRRFVVGLMLLAVTVGVVGGWFAMQGSDQRARAVEQARAIGDDWQTSVAVLGEKLASGSDALVARVDSMTTRVAGMWTQAAGRWSEQDAAVDDAGAVQAAGAPASSGVSSAAATAKD
ncbi:MAG: hypothetical protein KDI82_11155 [Gammaproteobacteria bacterium]|nr:hypothetical protein [Gammaproteobacteria bacterium]